MKKILSLALVVFTIFLMLSVGTTAESLEIPSDAVEFNGNFYKLYSDVVSWTEAKTKCKGYGGHLVTITSQEENNFIYNNLPISEDSYWIGASSDNDYNFSWVTGEKWDYENWAPDEPSNTIQHYVCIYGKARSSSAEWDDRWNVAGEKDELLGAYNGFICEWECGYTNVAIYNGHRYKVFTDVVSWTEAKAICEANGGYLATITSKEENNFICEKLPVNGDSYWIGASSDENYNYTWVTGEVWDYENWAPNEPSNTVQHYVCLYGELQADDTKWKWDDRWDIAGYQSELSLGAYSGFICEWGTDNLNIESTYHLSTCGFLGITQDIVYVNYDYKYSDTYFSKSTSKYNKKLMQLSMCFALSSMVNDGGDYFTKKPEVAEKFFLDTDFDNFSYYGYNEKPASGTVTSQIAEYIGCSTNDSAACVIGSKNIGETTIIAVSVRGMGYEGEWGSNFNVGSNGNHTGFDSASKYILYYLDEFIADYKEDFNPDVKVWITGYSRAAATANLTAAKLNHSSSLTKYPNVVEMDFDKTKVFAYTFETPLNTTKSNCSSSSYNNIFNIANPIDPVQQVAPIAWGFDRYGIDYYIPSTSNNSKYLSKYLPKLKEQYYTITGGDEYIEDFSSVKISLKKSIANGELTYSVNNSLYQSYYLDTLFKTVSKHILRNRLKYSTHYEETFTKFFKKYPFVFNDIPATGDLWDILKDKLDVPNILINGANLRLTLSEVLSEYLCDTGITVYEFYSLFGVVDDGIKGILSHPNTFLTLFYNKNYERLFIPHYPQVTFAWVMSCPNAFTRKSTYYKACLNCPIDVEVYDNDNTLVGAIINDEAQYFENSSVGSYVDENGQKVFFLPDDTEYHFEIKGNDTGTMSCCFEIYDYNTNTVSETVNYYDIPITTDSEITVKMSENELEDYSLSVLMEEDGEAIQFDETISNEDIKYYSIDTMQDGDLGSIIGGGEFIKGEYAKLIAYETEENSFIGWYVENEMVSAEKEYRFMVDSDVTVTGKFKNHTHIGGIATCTEKAICSICNQAYGEIDKTNHKNIAIDDAVAASCIQFGLTEGSHCDDCGAIVKKQNKISTIAHEDRNEDGYCDLCGLELEAHDNDSTNCSHLCHKNGFLGFIWKIINLFNKLFKINQYCECGEKHW